MMISDVTSLIVDRKTDHKIGQRNCLRRKTACCGPVIATNPKTECQKTELTSLVILEESSYVLMVSLSQVEGHGSGVLLGGGGGETSLCNTIVRCLLVRVSKK